MKPHFYRHRAEATGMADDVADYSWVRDRPCWAIVRAAEQTRRLSWSILPLPVQEGHQDLASAMSSAERRAFSQLAMSSLRDCVSQAAKQWRASLSRLDTSSDTVDQEVSYMQYQQCPACCNVLKIEPKRDNGPITDEPLFWFTVRFLHQEGGCRPLVPLPVRYNLPLFLGILLRDDVM
jgi:hypothetical protein